MLLDFRYHLPVSSLRACTVVAIFGMLTAAGCASSGPGIPASNAGSERAPATSAEPPAGTRVVNAPVIHRGDVWVDALTGTLSGANRQFRVESIAEDGPVSVNEWGNQIITTKDWNVLTYRSLTVGGAPPTHYKPAMSWFDFPLYAGKTWNKTSRWSTPDLTLRGKTITDGKVIGWEEVTVPAGTFRALKVEVKNRTMGRAGALDLVNITYWYVPEVNRFVRYVYQGTGEGRIEAELVSYRPARGRWIPPRS